MSTSDRMWTIARVPFPYTDRPVRRHRPALVVAEHPEHDLLWVLMITSAEDRGWPLHVRISARKETALPVPSIVRCAKIVTIDARQAEGVGILPLANRASVIRNLRRCLPSLSKMR